MLLPMAALLERRVFWKSDDVRELVVYLCSMIVHPVGMVVYFRNMGID